VHLQALPAVRPDVPLAGGTQEARVALVEATFDDDGSLLAYCARGGYHGIVVAALGVGHLSEAAAARAIEAAALMPVVLTSRAGAGGVFAHTYGFSGSESHLLSRGLVSGGMLGPRKARILLLMLLRSGADQAAISRAFRGYGGGCVGERADTSDVPNDVSSAR
jgi:L-asparaginase